MAIINQTEIIIIFLSDIMLFSKINNRIVTFVYSANVLMNGRESQYNYLFLKETVHCTRSI